MRVYKRKYYLMEHMASHQMELTERERYISIVTGHKAKLNKSYVVKEYIPTGQGMFNCADGHIPECQPVMTERDALKWLDINYTAYIRPVV